MKILKTIAGAKRRTRSTSKNKNSLKKMLRKTISTQKTTNNVHNLSGITLSDSQARVLSKGLSFIPSPKPTPKLTIEKSFSNFQRRIYLKRFFLNKGDLKPSHPFRISSGWQPPIPDNNGIQNYISNIYRDIFCTKQSPKTFQNITELEQQALRDLLKTANIIIKLADKGGKIVIWDRTAYLSEANRQLGDSKYYQVVEYNPLPKLIMDISTFLSFLKSQLLIEHDIFLFLNPLNNSRTPLFYMLPKIHKEGTPGRPIISGCGSPTANLSNFLDYYLKPIVQTIPSFIKDTTHFLRILREKAGVVPPDSLLVTFDVKSLYTNIPNEEEILCCLKAISNFYGENLPLPLKHLRQMLSFILEQNYFFFNGTYYLQIHGTAMGSPFAPNYANIFMADLEERILCSYPRGVAPLLWKRYIDDIYVIWNHGPDKLNEFYSHMNSSHDSIKFEMSFSDKRIHFLDTMTMILPNNTISTSLYKKPSDICS